MQVVEHGLGHLPFTEKQVITPTGNFFVSPREACRLIFCVHILKESVQKNVQKVQLFDFVSVGAGSIYVGVDFCKQLCGVSIIRR